MSCILDNHRGPVLWLHVRHAKHWRHTWHLSDCLELYCSMYIINGRQHSL